MTIQITITEDEWLDRFRPIENHLCPSAGFAWNDGNGCLFDWHGPERDFLMQQDQRCIWTLFDDSDGEGLSIASGMWRINRLGYFVTALPVPEGEDYAIILE